MYNELARFTTMLGHLRQLPSHMAEHPEHLFDDDDNEYDDNEYDGNDDKKSKSVDINLHFEGF